MQQLKLPEYLYQRDDERIFCLVRRKWVALTPEEWVRQHFINLLITHLSYPRGLIKLEQQLEYFKNAKRSDVTVLDQSANVFLLVECKSYNEKLGQAVVNQMATYNKVLNSRYLAITNGMTHFVWKKIGNDYQQINSFPKYSQ